VTDEKQPSFEIAISLIFRGLTPLSFLPTLLFILKALEVEQVVLEMFTIIKHVYNLKYSYNMRKEQLFALAPGHSLKAVFQTTILLLPKRFKKERMQRFISFHGLSSIQLLFLANSKT
jgi:hypothetical protein